VLKSFQARRDAMFISYHRRLSSCSELLGTEVLLAAHVAISQLCRGSRQAKGRLAGRGQRRLEGCPAMLRVRATMSTFVSRSLRARESG